MRIATESAVRVQKLLCSRLQDGLWMGVYTDCSQRVCACATLRRVRISHAPIVCTGQMSSALPEDKEPMIGASSASPSSAPIWKEKKDKKITVR